METVPFVQGSLNSTSPQSWQLSLSNPYLFWFRRYACMWFPTTESKNHNCNIDECSSILVISSLESNFADTMGRQSSTNRPLTTTSRVWVCVCVGVCLCVCVGGGGEWRLLLFNPLGLLNLKAHRASAHWFLNAKTGSYHISFYRTGYPGLRRLSAHA